MKGNRDYTSGKNFLKWLVTETLFAFSFLTFMLGLGVWYWIKDDDRSVAVIMSIIYLSYILAAFHNWYDLKRGIRK